jgi:predicted DNA-binding transcriptional regulator AlpA
MLNVSVRTLWRWLSGRKVPEPLRIGSVVRWRLDEVRSWIAGGCRMSGDRP